MNAYSSQIPISNSMNLFLVGKRTEDQLYTVSQNNSKHSATIPNMEVVHSIIFTA